MSNSFACSKCGQTVPQKGLDGALATECPICRVPLRSVSARAVVSPRDEKPLMGTIVKLPTPPAKAGTSVPVEPRPKPNLPMPPWVALGLGIFFGCMAVLFAVQGYFANAEKLASSSWPNTPGKITSCQLREVRGKPRRLPYEIIRHTVDVSYDYTVNGQDYEGHKIVFSDNLWEQNSAEARAAKYALGTSHPVFYDPRSPERCLLEPGETYEGDTDNLDNVMGFWLPLGMIPIVLLSFGMFIYGRMVS